MSHLDTLDLWLDGKHAGKLHRGHAGDVEFLYTEQYAHDLSTTPVSLSMPKSRLGHGPHAAQAWIENLLPEGDEVRTQWARHFGEHSTEAFDLLSHMGADAPGSVQIVPEGAEPSTAGELRPLTNTEIAHRIRSITSSNAPWAPSSQENPHFSLAGQQSKFALSRLGESWFEPTGAMPSTHIVKPGMQGVRTPAMDDQATEFVTMRAAKFLGLSTASVDIINFDNTPAFVTTRYDRITRGADTLRLHQEDFCQALSVVSHRKYESNGGPGIADIAHLITQYSSHRAADRLSLAQSLAFNLLTAGTDAHAKNHSVLLVGNNVRLAPLYDLISGHGIWPAKTLTHRGKTAFRYGKEYALAKITGRNLVRTADLAGIDRQHFIDLILKLADQLPDALSQALAQLPDIPVSDLVHALPENTEQFSRMIVHAIDLAEDLQLPHYRRRPQGLSVRADLWVPGHHGPHGWVSGHYRERSTQR